MIEDPSAENSASAQMPVQMTTVQDCHMGITEVELEFHLPIMRYRYQQRRIYAHHCAFMDFWTRRRSLEMAS